MLAILKALLIALIRGFRSHRDLILENLALRQQLSVLKAKHPQPQLAGPDRLFWVTLRRIWPGWKRALVLVRPDTVIRWHRTGFRLYWKWISRTRVSSAAGSRCRWGCASLFFAWQRRTPPWGAPRIHGELKMLGFDVCERTVLRWMRKAPRNPEPAKRWAAFLSNHRESIAAMDFFTVPTLTFGTVYCFFVIAHDRR